MGFVRFVALNARPPAAAQTGPTPYATRLDEAADGRVLVTEAVTDRVSVIGTMKPARAEVAGKTHLGGSSYVLDEGDRTCSASGD